MLRVLDRVAREWSEPIDLGESWDRPATPFHVVFHATPRDAAALRQSLGRHSIEFGDLADGSCGR
jgi:hypothetical protein